MQKNKNNKRLKIKFIINTILFVFIILGNKPTTFAQCRKVKPPVATLSILNRPCGPTATGSIELDIKGGLAPFTLSWTADGKIMDSLPLIANNSKLTVENLKVSMKPGYVVNIKDACEYTATASAPLLISVPLHFVNPPQVVQLVSNENEPNGKISVELRGGNTTKSVYATDSKGNTFKQSVPVGPAEKGIFKYELDKLPAEKYKIELKSGSEKCTQVWKETIELRAVEK